MQNSLSRKSATTWKQSTTFSPAEISVSNYQQHGNIQSFFRLQNSLRRRSSTTWKYSKTFSPAELSQPQMINNMEIFKSFPQAELSQPEIINNLEIVNEIFTGRNISVSNYQQHGDIQRFFRLQNCLSRRPSIPQKYANIFSPADMSWPQINHYPENIQRFFRLQNCLSRRSSLPRKYSNTFSPADMS